MATAASVGKQRVPAPAWVWVLAALWLAAWIYQLIAGLGVTGLGQQVVWGGYIAGFFTAAGAGVGLVTAAAYSGGGRAARATRTRLLTLAASSFIAAGVLITMDVGSPFTLWRLLVAFRFASLMTWDAWLLAIVFVLTVVLLYRKPRRMAGLEWLTVALGVALVAVEAWMLSGEAARSLWTGGRTLVSFLVGAAIAGQGLALLVDGYELRERLRRGLAAMLWLNLFLVVAEALSGLIGGAPRTSAEALAILGSGMFWLHLVVGMIVPLALVKGPAVRTAAALAVLGVLLEKLWYLPAGQEQPWLEGIPAAGYWPSLVEIIALAGVAALAALIYRYWSRSLLHAE
jgi:molybdopterin-containing oxidoreductase family membrane subunit